ncbi:aminopeptidase NAALADL1-like [Ixodes scapularis]
MAAVGDASSSGENPPQSGISGTNRPLSPSGSEEGFVISKIQLMMIAATMVLIVVTAIILVIFISRNAREGAIKPAVTPQGPNGNVSTIQGTPTATPTAQPELPMIVPEFDLLKSKIVREAMMSLRPEKLKEHLQFLSSKPHLSGTHRSEVDVVNYILREFGQNLDQAFKVPYTILHQYPDPNNPNKLQVIDAKGDVVMDAGMHEAAIPGIDTDSVPGYLAYSPTGTVEGDIIFVNYGTYPDFDKLEKNNISVKGFICLARYGGGHRGEKVRNCHERGGIATIIFSDPKAVSPLGLDKVYPNSQFVDGTALQRGALYTYGDPETPGYPSIKEALRYPNTSDMPQIPGLVIGYDDARLLFGYMGGDVVETTPELTAKWNMTYRRGPLKPEHAGMKVRLTVNNEWKRVEVFNVIGVLKGSHEPDRYSMLGNHHDAWARGTIDPSSATAPMLEQAYVLGQLVKKGIWRPRRSIIFGVWAAEEIAIAGSGEWGQYMDVIMHNKYAAWYTDPGSLQVIERQTISEYEAMHGHYRKPIMISEYGADAVTGLHADPAFVFTEDFQAQLLFHHHKAFDQLRSKGYFVGEHVWNFADFMTDQDPRRAFGNRKGIFTRNRQPKAAAKVLRCRYHKLSGRTIGDFDAYCPPS